MSHQDCDNAAEEGFNKLATSNIALNLPDESGNVAAKQLGVGLHADGLWSEEESGNEEDEEHDRDDNIVWRHDGTDMAEFQEDLRGAARFKRQRKKTKKVGQVFIAAFLLPTVPGKAGWSGD